LAVCTHLSEKAIQDILTHYRAGTLVSFGEVIEGSRNTTYQLTTTERRLILRLLEGDRYEDEGRRELALIRHLGSHGVPCAEVLPTREGEDFLLFMGRCTSLFSFIEGTKVSELPSPSVGQLRQMGEVLARMHRAARDWSIRRKQGLVFEPLLARLVSREREVASHFGAAHGPIMDRVRHVLTHDFGSLPWGLLHNDLFPDNVFVQGEDISGVIDFSECLEGPLVHDLAVVLNQWTFMPSATYHPGLVHAFLAGYQSIRPLEPRERAALPVALDRAAITFLLVRLLLFHLEPDLRVERRVKPFQDLLPLVLADKRSLTEGF